MRQRPGLNGVWTSRYVVIGIRVRLEKGGRIEKLMSLDTDMPILLFGFVRAISQQSDFTYASGSIRTIVYQSRRPY